MFEQTNAKEGWSGWGFADPIRAGGEEAEGHRCGINSLLFKCQPQHDDSLHAFRIERPRCHEMSPRRPNTKPRHAVRTISLKDDGLPHPNDKVFIANLRFPRSPHFISNVVAAMALNIIITIITTAYLGTPSPGFIIRLELPVQAVLGGWEPPSVSSSCKLPLLQISPVDSQPRGRICRAQTSSAPRLF
ncbi:hypothetical protein DM02DRAFT_623699 [Periconia macrospinosa]|uniref:Uncharacterized protein n=1 Tax=Periconia macrospinosa TaxID=97972 RepID=A0A2V1E9V9_9PLEO|nr:hypothetical protein DM02DRAFT_623699 [Periconia macrospinosa]